MLVNRKFLRIFLVFLILFGGYQIYEVLAVKSQSVSGVVTLGTVALIATVMAIAGYVLYKAK
jgi:hypothetical protein